MRRIATILLAIALHAVAPTIVEATPIISLNGRANPVLPPIAKSTGGLDLYIFSIDNAANYLFDTIDVTILVDSGKAFVSPLANATFAPAGGDETAFLGLTTIATGLTIVGIEATPTRLSGVITAFGGGGASAGNLNDDFAQVVGAPGLTFSYTINFALAGSVVLEQVTGTFGIPEPTTPEPKTIVLAGIGLLGSAGHRRSR